ncbi:flippase [Fodinibius sp. AD559]|uniref:flippase n=1 Tax=Fodinibius sp. AD559 TaxID=3424179 RepID=UPI004046F4EB
MFELVRKLFKQSSIYAFGDILTKGVGFFLLPLYTAYLTPEDYGIISLATVAATIFTIISTGGLKGAVLKFYYNFDQADERKQFYGTLWLFYLVVPGLFLLVLELKGDEIFKIILPSVAYHPYIRLALWTYYLKAIFTEMPLQIFKAKSEAKKHTLLKVGIFFFSTVLTVWFVVFWEQGAKGLLYAKFLGNLLIAVVVGYYLYKFIQITFRWKYLKKALLYSLPMVPHFLSHWVLSSSDRLVLEYFVPLGEVGVYNVGYTIGSAMSMIALAGNNAIIPLYGDLDLKDKSGIRDVVKSATYYICVIVGIALLVVLFAEDFIYLAIPESYHGAISVIPWVVLGYVFMAFYFTQINLLTITLGKTNVVGISTAIAAFANIGLNILLIPYLGMVGAAITTAFTYLLLFIGMKYFSKRAHPLPFEYMRMAKVLLAGIIVYLGAYFVTPSTVYLSVPIKVLGLLLFVVLLYFFNFFNKDEITFIKNKIDQNI